MLPKFYREYDRAYLPRIQKTVSGEDASMLGAFSFGTVIKWTVRLPRRLGAAAVVVRFWRDGEESQDVALTFIDTNLGEDVYEWSFDTRDVCQGKNFGLFYYCFLLVRGQDTLFTNSINNVDFTLSERPACPFRLLVHTPDFKTPSWFHGGTMYHIFVDRFCRGEGYAPLREGATLETDWQNGIPQFAPYPGAPVANDRFFGGNLWDWTARHGIDYCYTMHPSSAHWNMPMPAKYTKANGFTSCEFFCKWLKEKWVKG